MVVVVCVGLVVPVSDIVVDCEGDTLTDCVTIWLRVVVLLDDWVCEAVKLGVGNTDWVSEDVTEVVCVPESVVVCDIV